MRFYDVYPAAVPCEVMQEVVRRFIDGAPMSAVECERFCLLEQIKRLHRRPLTRLAKSVSDRLMRWYCGIRFLKLRHSRR